MKKSKEAVEGNHQAEGTENNRNGGLVLVECSLTGMSPMLQNAMSQETLLSLWEGPTGKGSRNRERPSPRDHANDRVHKLADGRPCCPCPALYAALVNAGQYVRLDGKRQVSTLQKTILPGMLLIQDVELPLYVPGKDTPATWEVDVQQGRNPNGGEAVCIVRPRFDAWELRCTLEIDTQEMPLKLAYSLVQIAGKRIGLFDFRPQRKGTFGRFHITQWQPQKD